jgi:hypothetical protein
VDETVTHVRLESSDREKTLEEEFTNTSEFKTDKDCYDVATLAQGKKQDNRFLTTQEL